MDASELERIFLAASEAARRARHEYVTVEHLLLTLLEDEAVAEVVQGCGADLEALRQRVARFLEREHQPHLAEGAQPIPTLAVRRVVQRAALHVEAAGKERVRAEDLFVALYTEEGSHALFFLREAGLERLDVVSYIAHGRPAEEEGPGPEGEPEGEGEG
ncbi:MAG: ATP-dependent Clp protease ATP-binding subunit ClpA, partial [Nitrospirae bacterium]